MSVEAHAAGVVGKQIEADLPVFLQQLREELLQGAYRPAPARQTYIPKPNGKLRPLGIPIPDVKPGVIGVKVISRSSSTETGGIVYHSSLLP